VLVQNMVTTNDSPLHTVDILGFLLLVAGQGPPKREELASDVTSRDSNKNRSCGWWTKTGKP
jgi:hypothetical protein